MLMSEFIKRVDENLKGKEFSAGNMNRIIKLFDEYCEECGYDVILNNKSYYISVNSDCMLNCIDFIMDGMKIIFSCGNLKLAEISVSRKKGETKWGYTKSKTIYYFKEANLKLYPDIPDSFDEILKIVNEYKNECRKKKNDEINDFIIFLDAHNIAFDEFQKYSIYLNGVSSSTFTQIRNKCKIKGD